MSDRILVMSERPGRIVEEIPVDLPDRDNPLARISAPRAREYVDHLLASLHLAGEGGMTQFPDALRRRQSARRSARCGIRTPAVDPGRSRLAAPSREARGACGWPPSR